MLNKLDFSILRQHPYGLASVAGALVLAALGVLVIWSLPVVYEAPIVTEPVALESVVSPVEDIFVANPPIYFTGDSMLGRYVETLIKQDAIAPDDFVALFSTSSAVVTNFESAMVLPHEQTPSGAMRFSVDASSLELLESLSVTHASLANNHSRDYGMSGYRTATDLLAKQRITSFGDAIGVGTSSIAYLSVGHESIGIIGIHTLFTTPTADELQPLVAAMTSSSSLQIAYVHWGNEYQLVHAPAQERFAKLLVDLGVDVIVAHHPHVTQDIQFVDGVPVFYSLGNFIFDQYFSPDVMEGYVLGLTLQPKSFTLTLYPHYQCARSTPCFMSETQSQVYLNALADRSSALLREQIMAKTIVIPR